jgi:hypothetical protein
MVVTVGHRAMAGLGMSQIVLVALAAKQRGSRGMSRIVLALVAPGAGKRPGHVAKSRWSADRPQHRPP